MQPYLLTPPATTPVSLAEAKTHCRVDHSGDDTYITGLIGAAVGHLDGRAGILGRCIMEQVWVYPFAKWPASGYLKIDIPDVSAAVVKYFDTDGAEQTVSSSVYRVERAVEGAHIWFTSGFTWPDLYIDRPSPISVTVTAAMPSTAPALQAIRHAMLLMIGHWYENREEVVVGQLDVRSLPMAVGALLSPLRRVGF